jgi:hypothetical protein
MIAFKPYGFDALLFIEPSNRGKPISSVDFTDSSSAPAFSLISERLFPDVNCFIRPSIIELIFDLLSKYCN